MVVRTDEPINFDDQGAIQQDPSQWDVVVIHGRELANLAEPGLQADHH